MREPTALKYNKLIQKSNYRSNIDVKIFHNEILILTGFIKKIFIFNIFE